ncbi:trypsin-like peptidase domain-containing protein [Alkalilimnicola sp. S0819]|uniref:trypsin-like peptidase domain-containing protein n=1 Tax=Alkalilimnicola sp. S0819 TaxID=2613922 RepID=UPI0012628F2E|nr:trypsin-like peptidase domain-containing protein [Alkalilimnicola sp. S0819]KAB7623926.1 trypsin-like serine protease [Alkalilimnicola sp. S0819]MPQ16523.1 trypsin-like serine protease [Alkalilimnicola sp. S0819]
MRHFRLVFLLLSLLLGATPVVAAPSAATLPRGEAPTLAPLLERVLPGVVDIVVEGPLDRGSGAPALAGAGKRQFEGIGAGVVLDAERGHILTNAHVLEAAERITVRSHDGHRRQARLVGTDPSTDLALLHIAHPPPGLRNLVWSKPGSTRVGDLVLAIGNPFGLYASISSGVVSALGRQGLGIQGYEDFIQTDAAINPGHSGGPLVNLKGEVVGINLAILAPGGGSIGIGFALPGDIARRVGLQMSAQGDLHRGRIGLLVEEQWPADEARPPRVLVREVLKGSGAARAGLRQGDVILAADGEALQRSAQLRNRVALRQVGERLRLRLQRDGAVIDRDVEIVEEPAVMAEAPAELDYPVALLPAPFS